VLRVPSAMSSGLANASHAKLCGRSRVPKPERRGGCRREVALQRLPICNRRDAAALAAT